MIQDDVNVQQVESVEKVTVALNSFNESHERSPDGNSTKGAQFLLERAREAVGGRVGTQCLEGFI